MNPQCVYVILDAVGNGRWRCQDNDDHEPEKHAAPPNARVVGPWFIADGET